MGPRLVKRVICTASLCAWSALPISCEETPALDTDRLQYNKCSKFTLYYRVKNLRLLHLIGNFSHWFEKYLTGIKTKPFVLYTSFDKPVSYQVEQLVNQSWGSYTLVVDMKFNRWHWKFIINYDYKMIPIASQTFTADKPSLWWWSHLAWMDYINQR